MEAAIQLFKKYPASVICFIIYVLIWLGVAFGDGQLYGPLLIFYGFAFGLVMLLNGSLRKEGNKVYFIITALVALPIIILFIVISFL